MTSHLQEDDWELDMNLGLDAASTNHLIFQRKGVYSMEPDKELALACERYQYPSQHYYLEDDDTNSSVTSGSVLSEKYSVDMALNDLDDFMYDEPPSASVSTTMRAPAIQQYDFSQFPGVVKRLGPSSRYQEVQDNDDWNDDIDIPTKGISLLHPTTEKIYDQQLSSLDDDDIEEEPIRSLPRIQQQAPLQHTTRTALPSSSRPRNLFRYEPEKDDEDDDMTGLDFPENMGVLPKRLDEKKRYTPQPTNSPAASNSATRIPVSRAKSKFLSSVQRESDDDDFCDGLNIKDKAFTLSPSPTSSRLPQQRSTTKGKEPANFVSRLARPSPLLHNSSRQSDHAAALAKRTTHQQSPSQQKQQKLPAPTPRHTFLAGTKASRQREADIAASRLNKSKTTTLTMNKNLVKANTSAIDNSPAERKSANGYTLIARPKTKMTTGYCTRLDNIDNLNDLRPTRAASNRKNVVTQQKTHPKGESKSDPDRPWRRNMQSTNGRSKIKLIQPSEQNLKKEYNNMTYDDSTHCWKGNETSLIGFQEKPVATHRRPMLIMNKQQKYAPSRYAAVVGSSMIFNTESQKWISANGSGEECNELDTIEDLKDELLHSPTNKRSNNLYHNSNQVDEKLLDFKLSIEVKRQMMYEQEQHESWMANWPIKSISAQQYF